MLGLNLLYAPMNRIVKARDLNTLYIAGPAHVGPNSSPTPACLEGTYSGANSATDQNETGMRTLFRQFSFPGGRPSHVAPEMPSPIHEGGEIGDALVTGPVGKHDSAPRTAGQRSSVYDRWA